MHRMLALVYRTISLFKSGQANRRIAVSWSFNTLKDHWQSSDVVLPLHAPTWCCAAPSYSYLMLCCPFMLLPDVVLPLHAPTWCCAAPSCSYLMLCCPFILLPDVVLPLCIRTYSYSSLLYFYLIKWPFSWFFLFHIKYLCIIISLVKILCHCINTIFLGQWKSALKKEVETF